MALDLAYPKPIPTDYKGVAFRSRLEARWAVYFDFFGIKWEYEKEGYVLGEVGAYLPDLWLPQVRMWAEVKPASFEDWQIDKCHTLFLATKSRCLLLDGAPECRSYFSTMAARTAFVGDDYFLDADYLAEGRFFCSTGAGWPEPSPSDNRDIKEASDFAKAFRFW